MIVMSCNVRYSRAKDGPDGWPLRRELCLRVILSRNPDVVCFQELTDEQFAWLSRGMPAFESAGTTDEPAGTDPVTAIFWRTDRLALKSTGTYWLSRTPHVAGSKSWASDCVRMVTWARLAVRNDGAEREVRIVNTHLDHISQRARVHQARMIAQDCAAYPPGYPQVLTGDFNCDRDNPAAKALLKSGFLDTYQAVHGKAAPIGTGHGFHGLDGADRIAKIDWVLMRGNVSVRAAEIVTDSEDGRYPSDHFFVLADVEPGPAGGA
jgi:endonuclease/exonuclease/phosphatase family metal-dependent hydrolase